MLACIHRTCKGTPGQWLAHLGTETVAHSTNILDSESPEGPDAGQHNRVDSLGCVRVIAVGTLAQPPHNVKPRRAVHLDGITIEQV